jgi:hypothetical protein
MEYMGKPVQAKERFSKKETAAPHVNATDCVSEITPAGDSFKAKKRNAEAVQGVAKKSKGTIAEMYDISITMKHVVHGWII